jgi:hypothetical protein
MEEDGGETNKWQAEDIVWYYSLNYFQTTQEKIQNGTREENLTWDVKFVSNVRLQVCAWVGIWRMIIIPLTCCLFEPRTYVA